MTPSTCNPWLPVPTSDVQMSDNPKRLEELWRAGFIQADEYQERLAALTAPIPSPGTLSSFQRMPLPLLLQPHVLLLCSDTHITGHSAGITLHAAHHFTCCPTSRKYCQLQQHEGGGYP